MKIPDDVRAWVRSVFRACNVRTANMLGSMPNTHETTLDHAFIAEAARFSAPMRFESEWIVRIDTHFLGGGRHWGEWEIADIGILVQFRRGGKVAKSKVLLLQSKRLYAVEEDYDEDERADYEIGFARLFRGDTLYPDVTTPRVFAFGDESKYAALIVNDGQFKAIDAYETQYGIPVHYLLYHPPRVPSQVELPAVKVLDGDDVAIGARVVPATGLRNGAPRPARQTLASLFRK